MPPFAPQPHAGEQPLRSLSVTSAHTQQQQQQQPQPVSTVTCNAHEVCHYFQQVFYVSAILTGIALVIAGAIQTGAPDATLNSELPLIPSGMSEPDGAVGGGDLLVFVYIGVLLIGVNMSLLLLQCYMRSKELRRARRMILQPPSVPPATVHYNPLVSVGPPRQVVMPCAMDLASSMHRQQQPQMPSPGKAQRRGGGYGPASVHSVATVPAIPSAQPHWLLTPGSRAATVASQPPPSYDNLLVVGHTPRDVATLHLI